VPVAAKPRQRVLCELSPPCASVVTVVKTRAESGGFSYIDSHPHKTRKPPKKLELSEATPRRALLSVPEHPRKGESTSAFRESRFLAAIRSGLGRMPSSTDRNRKREPARSCARSVARHHRQRSATHTLSRNFRSRRSSAPRSIAGSPSMLTIPSRRFTGLKSGASSGRRGESPRHLSAAGGGRGA
jgi:hypothetical protein